MIISFPLGDLHHEIANIAYVAADVALTADNHHRLHQTFDICEDANIDRINNLLTLAFAEVKSVLSIHNSQCIMHNSMPDSQFILDCRSREFDPATVNLLKELIREFLVCRALHGWLSVTLPEAAAMWRERATSLLSRITTLSLSGSDTLRRSLSPF